MCLKEACSSSHGLLQAQVMVLLGDPTFGSGGGDVSGSRDQMCKPWSTVQRALLCLSERIGLTVFILSPTTVITTNEGRNWFSSTF